MDRVKSLLTSKWSVLLMTVALVVTPLASAQAWSLLGSLVTVAYDTVLAVISFAAYIVLISIMGQFATLATKLLVYTAQLNNFTDLPVIVEAWQVVRDLSNMMFIVILLVIAFGTLFRLEAYSWKKLLPKMILAAILVNYSRAICGFIVDASQVVMLTFVAAIKDAADVGLTSAFQLNKLLEFGASTGSEYAPGVAAVKTSSTQRLLAIFAAGFMLSTMFTVQCVYIVVLMGRLVMIWFLTVLSPLAYVTRVLPQTERYSSQWWEMFSRYVVVGPLCMFFLWLAMFIAAKSIDSGGLGSVAASEEVTAIQLANATEDPASAGALDTTLISGFIIATMMLMAGMKLAQENSSELGEYTGKVAGAAAVGTMFGASILARKAIGYGNDWQFARTGVDLNASRVVDRWKHGLEANKKAKVTQGESTAAQKYREGFLLAGVTGAGDQVAELGVRSEQLRGGLTGNIPLLRNWDRGRKSFLGGRQGKFERTVDEEKKINDEANKNAEDIKTFKDANSNLTTVAEFNKEHEAKKAGDNDVLDASNEAQRAILEKYQSALQELSSDPTLTDDERKKATVAAANMNKAIKNKSGTVNLNGPSLNALKGLAGGEFGKLITDTKKASKDDADAFNADRVTRTKNGTLNTQDDIDNELLKDRGYAALLAKKIELTGDDGKGGKLAAVKKKREILGSQMGSGGELKLRKLVSEAATGITSEDTTELCDGFKDAVHKGSGFGPEALAYFDRLAATNNVNDLLSDPAVLEWLHEMDPSLKGQNAYSQQGMKALSQVMIKKFGMPEQAVMSTMHRGFQHMKRSGNTFMSEQTEVKNGNYTWRSEKDWQKVALIESRKRNTSQQLASATRLQLGDGDKFYDQQRFTLENLGTLIAPALGTDKKVRLNSDIIRHLATDSKRYMVMRNKLINSVKDNTLRKQALDALNEALRKGGVELSKECDDLGELSEDTKAYEPTEL